ncbi:permease [Marinactinospora rubrisoli]|uniref:Permease n=1 Tax=Marinactinospora rubrisoli TaxID=2715399 RepID=A0ABW2KR23_9ACTN
MPTSAITTPPPVTPLPGAVGELLSGAAARLLLAGPAAGLASGGGPDLLEGAGRAAGYLLVAGPLLIAGLLVAAAVDALAPRAPIARLLGDGRRSYRSALAGALLGAVTPLCSGSAAPVAVALRRRGAPLAGAVAFWAAGPLLNPAALALCLAVLPWPWALARAGAGLLVALLVAGYAGRAAPPLPPDEPAHRPPAPPRLAARRFGRSLARITRATMPDHLVLLLAVAIAGTWLNGAPWDEHPIAAPLVAAAAAALLAVPWGGEIPAAAALATAGAPGAAAAALVTLPVLGLPALATLRAIVPPRHLAVLAAGVALTGAIAGGAVGLGS